MIYPPKMKLTGISTETVEQRMLTYLSLSWVVEEPILMEQK